MKQSEYFTRRNALVIERREANNRFNAMMCEEDGRHANHIHEENAFHSLQTQRIRDERNATVNAINEKIYELDVEYAKAKEEAKEDE